MYWFVIIMTLILGFGPKIIASPTDAKEGMPTIRSLTDLKSDLEKLTDKKERFFLEIEIVRNYASATLNSENVNEAKTYASGILKTSRQFKRNWNYSNAVHYSHLVLGRVELFNKNIKAAANQLKMAGQVKGSPQLKAFGPNMFLAKELLQQGESKTVLNYLESCSRFWNHPEAKTFLSQWKTDIRQGKIPAFTVNLEI